MKYGDTISILKTVIDAIKDPTTITDKFNITEILNFHNTSSTNTNTNKFSSNMINTEQCVENVPIKDSSSYVDNKSNDYYSKKKNTTSNPQGVIDSIANELTSVRLQQAIILSEIVGKPKSKTRKRRRF